MGCLDMNFSCPVCFGEVMQVNDGEEIYFICMFCDSGPLLFCDKCLGLNSMESLIHSECVFCETEELLGGGQGLESTQKYYF